MKITVKAEETYFPEWNKNRKLSKDERVCVHYRYLTGPERDEFIGLAPIKYDKEGQVIDGLQFRLDKYEIVKTSIITIDNLTANDEIIVTGQQVGEIPELAGLYIELADFFLEVNQVINKKK